MVFVYWYIYNLGNTVFYICNSKKGYGEIREMSDVMKLDNVLLFIVSAPYMYEIFLFPSF